MNTRYLPRKSFILPVLLLLSMAAVGGCDGSGPSILPSNFLSPEQEAVLSQEVLELTNDERVEAGLAPLTWNATLAEAAAAHGEDMIERNYFDHESPEGENVADRVTARGYVYMLVGENIAAGQDSPEEVVDAWMNSEGHRANILRPEFIELGVGVKRNYAGRYYWVQVFGTPMPE
ncbi:MAG: CAP domain-containing protein [Phycisphaerae bacterium]|nr:CAP domain-containing protein [Phycisphaerae bacterium]